MLSEVLYQFMDKDLLDSLPDEWGVTIHTAQPRAIGYATTLTPKLIKDAAAQGIDLLVTHHDVWDFMFDEREKAYMLLEKHRISHIWCHTPLDMADFGTAAALIEEIGCEIETRIVDDDGRVGVLSYEADFSELMTRLSALMGEEPSKTYDSGRAITRVACVPGGGNMTTYLKEAAEYEIDLYITGETSLYLLEYARHLGVSVLIYSHNGTEIFGTHNLATMIADALGLNRVIRLSEPHF